ncbi:MAG: TolC family protein [Reichenbachiella sp.]|uniref:TolC family protein n=1 Tax=Reichenbachiella sp. TaxID=2184521 RepID=UPI003264B155
MNNQTRKAILAIGVFCLFFGNIVTAQEPLSLSQAIEMGLKNNFSIQIEQNKQLQAANNNTWGQAGMFPNIALGLGGGLSKTSLDNPASFLSSGNIKSNNYNPTINLNWVLFNGLNVQITKQKLELLQDQSEGNAAVIIENTVQAIILAYYNVLLERERTEVFANTLSLSRDRYDYVKLKGELGSAVTFDILRDKNAYLTDSSNYITQILNHRNAVRNLNLLLAQPIDMNYLFSDSLEVQKTAFNLDEMASAMKSSNSNLRNQYVNQEILRKDIRIASSALYPNLNLGVSGSKNWQTQDLSDAQFSNGTFGESGIKSTTGNLSANLTLSFTLFNGGKIRNQIKNAQIQERIGQLQIKDLELTLDNSLISTYDQYNLRQNLNAIASENLETANLNLEMGEERYRNGSINSFNYRDLQITYLQTALSYYQSIYNLIESKTELLRLSGGILSEPPN